MKDWDWWPERAAGAQKRGCKDVKSSPKLCVTAPGDKNPKEKHIFLERTFNSYQRAGEDGSPIDPALSRW